MRTQRAFPKSFMNVVKTKPVRIGLLFTGVLLPLSLLAQNTLCTINPAKIGEGVTVSGSFNSHSKLTSSMAFFQEVDDPSWDFFDKKARIVNYRNTYDNPPFSYPDDLKVVWNSPGGYNLDNIRHRVVSGDFDHDGSKDDIAALYNNGNGTTSVHLWLYNDDTDVMNFHNVWTTTGYTAGMTTGRVVSGDFDNDGWLDDIAVFYDYGSGTTGIHVWKINGISTPSLSSWWHNSGFTASQIQFRVVAGDFDRDNYIDDIAAMYDHGGGLVSIFVYQSNGSSFSGSTWWQTTTGYTPAQINKRILAGNFDESKKTGKKHKNDDIAAFYDYGGGVTKIHLFKSNGSSFSSHDMWNGPTFTATNITGRVAAMELEHPAFFSWSGNDNSDRCSAIGGFYDYGPSTNKMNLWRADQVNNSTKLNSSYNVFCDQQKPAPSNEGPETGTTVSENNKLLPPHSIQKNTGIYNILSVTDASMEQNVPNPFSNETVIRFNLPQQISNAFMTVYDLSGRELKTLPIHQRGASSITVTADQLEAGMYIYSITADGKIVDSKRMVVAGK